MSRPSRTPTSGQRRWATHSAVGTAKRRPPNEARPPCQTSNDLERLAGVGGQVGEHVEEARADSAETTTQTPRLDEPVGRVPARPRAGDEEAPRHVEGDREAEPVGVQLERPEVERRRDGAHAPRLRPACACEPVPKSHGRDPDHRARVGRLDHLCRRPIVHGDVVAAARTVEEEVAGHRGR